MSEAVCGRLRHKGSQHISWVKYYASVLNSYLSIYTNSQLAFFVELLHLIGWRPGGVSHINGKNYSQGCP